MGAELGKQESPSPISVLLHLDFPPVPWGHLIKSWSLGSLAPGSSALCQAGGAERSPLKRCCSEAGFWDQGSPAGGQLWSPLLWEQRDPGFLRGGRGQQKLQLVPLMSCNHALLAIIRPCLLTFTPARDEPVAAPWPHMSWGGSANGFTWGSCRPGWANKIRGFSKRKACSCGVLFHHGSLLPTVDAASGDSSRLLSGQGLWKSGDFKGLSCGFKSFQIDTCF